MNKHMRLFGLLTVCFWLISCASTKSMNEEVEAMRIEALKELDVYSCIMEGKAVAAVGMFGTPSCIEIYSDGGKLCDDSSECQGACTSREVLAEGAKTAGFCRGSEIDAFGCFNVISNGVAEHAICQD